MQEVTTLGVVELVGQFGVLGILAWFLWYRTSVADPAREKKLTESFENMHQRHTSQMAQLQSMAADAHRTCEETIDALHRESREALTRVLHDYQEQAALERRSHVADFKMLSDAITNFDSRKGESEKK